MLGRPRPVAGGIIAKPTLYRTLELAPSAGRQEIRAAYVRQMARIGSGELVPGLKAAVERAYVTLDNPDRRVRYDLQLVKSLQSARRLGAPSRTLSPKGRDGSQAPGRRLQRLALAPLRPASWRPISRLELTAAVLALIAVVSGIGLRRASVGRETQAKPAQVVASRAVAPIASQWADLGSEATIAIEIEQPSPAPSPSPEPVIVRTNLSQPAPRPVFMAAPVASPNVIVAPATEAVLLQAEPTPAASPAFQAMLAPVVREDSPNHLPNNAPRIWSRLFWGTKVSLRVAGQYCSDSGGGQIYMPFGAPVPPSLSC